MGVQIMLEGMRDWPSYLEREVDDLNIDEDTATQWAEDYDGYKIQWTFTGPAIDATANGAIDGACIRDDANAEGGICAGLEYNGSLTYTAEKWAIWVPTANFETFDENSGLVGEVDTLNWYVVNDETSFTDTFAFYRWQP